MEVFVIERCLYCKEKDYCEWSLESFKPRKLSVPIERCPYYTVVCIIERFPEQYLWNQANCLYRGGARKEIFNYTSIIFLKWIFHDKIQEYKETATQNFVAAARM